MKKTFICKSVGLLLLSGYLTACNRQENAETPPLPQVTVQAVAAKPIRITENLPGRITAMRVAEIRPQVSGIVQKRLFEQGSEVRAGQALFQINPAPFKADVDTAIAALKRSEAVLKRAKQQELRLQPLLKFEAISRQTYDDAVSQREQAAADVEQARATLERRKLDLRFATVEAPISGRIDQALITEGALVSSTDSNPMARIQQIDKVYVDVRKPASSLDSLQQSLSTDKQQGIPVELLHNSGEPYHVPGKILFSGINVDEGTGDVLLRIQVDNQNRSLLPGMFVRARIPLASYSDALAVPQQSVIRMNGEPFLWTVGQHSTAHLVPVVLGELTNRQYIIRSGITANQKVVIEGMDRLTENAAVTATDANTSASATMASAQ